MKLSVMRPHLRGLYLGQGIVRVGLPLQSVTYSLGSLNVLCGGSFKDHEQKEWKIDPRIRGRYSITGALGNDALKNRSHKKRSGLALRVATARTLALKLTRIHSGHVGKHVYFRVTRRKTPNRGPRVES